MIIAIDPGYIGKRYGRKMQYLCRIRDGSEWEFADGPYNLLFADKTALKPKEAILGTSNSLSTLDDSI